MRLKNFLGAIALGALLSPTIQAETVTLTSLDWPPYTGESLKSQGASVAVAKAAFEAVGYELKVEFYPWRRAVALAQEDSAYDGYFPEYYAESLKEDFILSPPIGTGPLGFAQRKDKPVNWSDLSDLTDESIGVVSGYVNTTDFDQMAAKGDLATSEAGDDTKNLQKLLHGRISLAIVDKNVLEYLLATDPALKGAENNIEFNPTLLEDKKLYICFKKGERGEKLAAALEEGLKKIDVEAIMAEHL